ncbi:MAG: hypothetical protein ACW99G_17700 [Candidatus Thorarchaeota archaeon]|jgi:hypothetical protein
MSVEDIIRQLNQVRQKAISIASPQILTHQPHDLFATINADADYYGNTSIHDAVVTFMARTEEWSRIYIEKAPNLTENPQFHERLALVMESTDLPLMNSGQADRHKLLNAVFSNDSLHHHERVQQALAVLIRNIPERAWRGPNHLAHALARVVIPDVLRSNIEIVRAIAENFVRWEKPGWLFQNFRKNPNSREFLKNPIFVDAYMEMILDTEKFDQWVLPRDVFDDTTFVPVLTKKLTMMEDPIDLIEVVWSYRELREDPTIQKTIMNCVGAVAKVLSESSTPYWKVRHIRDVSILLNEKPIQEALISNARLFIERIIKEDIPENPEEGRLGQAQETLYYLPFLLSSSAVKSEYKLNSLFKKIIDILFPDYSV